MAVSPSSDCQSQESFLNPNSTPKTSYAIPLLLWGAVFPLGMYAACTWHMDAAMHFGFLSGIAHAFLLVALAAWIATFAGMAHALAGRLAGGARLK
jgi:tellurite resistance protein TehA-like permease